ncbi:MAG: GldG family protein [bacterium]
MKREQAVDYTGILGGVLLLFGTGLYVFMKEWSPLVITLLVAGGLGTAVYLLFSGPELFAGTSGKRLAENTNMILYTVIVIGILCFVNYLGYKHNKMFDLTEEKFNTLADESVKAAKGLKGPVTVAGYFTKEQANSRDAFEALIRRYAAQNSKIQYTIVDPLKEPDKAEQAGVKVAPTILIESGDRKIQLTDTDEEALTNGLLQLVGRSPMVCFLIGHGERSPDDYNEDGYSDVGQALLKKNFKTRTAEILKDQKIPDECEVLVVGGPTVPLLQGEMAILQTYLDQGGKMVLLLEPLKETNIGNLLTPYGVSVRKQLIIEPKASFPEYRLVPIVTEDRYNPQSEIMEDIGLSTIYPLAQPIWTASPAPAGVGVTWLMKTTPDSWAETEVNKQTAEKNMGVDPEGPLILAVAITKEDTRIVAIGNASFATNNYVRQVASNEFLFVNMARWLSKQENLISIPHKERKGEPLVLTDNDLSKIVMLFFAGIPALFIVAGIASWWRRRRL